MSGLLSFPRKADALRRVDDSLAGPVSVFESETLAVISETTPYSEHAILHGVAVMIAVALALLSVVKLDRVVSGSGKVAPTEGSLFVQPLDRSIVREIKVSAGDLVKKGQILATLDPTFAAADLTQLQQKMASSAALVARLEAERAGKNFDAGENPDHSYQSQAMIWRQRQSEFQQGVADFDARIRSTEAKIAFSQADVLNYEKRRVLAAKIETMDSTLEQHGNGSKLKTLMSTDSLVDIERLRAESQGLFDQSTHDLAALKAQREVFIVKWQEDIGTQLVAARDDLALARQGLSKAERVSQLIDLVRRPRTRWFFRSARLRSARSSTLPTAPGKTSSRCLRWCRSVARSRRMSRSTPRTSASSRPATPSRSNSTPILSCDTALPTAKSRRSARGPSPKAKARRCGRPFSRRASP